MAKLFAVFLVASLAIVQASAAIQCYSCIGYNSSLPINDHSNNPYCVSESFVASKVPKKNSQTDFCLAFTGGSNFGEVTIRSVEEELVQERKRSLRRVDYWYIYQKAYKCTGNLCNGKPISSAGTPVLLLPLLLIPVAMSLLLV